MPPDDLPRGAAIWRIRDRATFRALRAQGKRGRCGPISVIYLPDPSRQPPGVAFAVSRRVGGAAVRNRLRRRLRAAIRELAPGPGAYLVTATPEAAAVPYQQLLDWLSEAVLAAGGTTR